MNARVTHWSALAMHTHAHANTYGECEHQFELYTMHEGVVCDLIPQHKQRCFSSFFLYFLVHMFAVGCIPYISFPFFLRFVFFVRRSIVVKRHCFRLILHYLCTMTQTHNTNTKCIMHDQPTNRYGYKIFKIRKNH